MTDISKLRELLKRVENATGPAREIDAEICVAFSYPERHGYVDPTWEAVDGVVHIYAGPHQIIVEKFKPNPLTSSIDAAVALCERVLPGWNASGVLIGHKPRVAVTKSSPLRPMPVIGEAATPALSFCAAILRAKIAMLEKESE